MLDALMVAYLAGTSVLLAGLDAPWPWLALRGLVLLGIAAARLGRLPALLHRHYALPLCFLLYLELDCYGPLTGGAVFDATVLAWERACFGPTSPAMWLSQALPYRALSEFLHLGYLSYYLMVPVLLWRRTVPQLEALQRAGVIAWIVGFLCFIFFPVEGPRPHFPPLDESLQGPIYHFTHWLLGGGAARGAAFPSIHAAMGTLVFVLAWRWNRRLAWVLAPFTAALLLGTVYGRFHYAVDTLAGMLLAVLATRRR